MAYAGQAGRTTYRGSDTGDAALCQGISPTPSRFPRISWPALMSRFMPIVDPSSVLSRRPEERSRDDWFERTTHIKNSPTRFTFLCKVMPKAALGKLIMTFILFERCNPYVTFTSGMAVGKSTLQGDCHRKCSAEGLDKLIPYIRLQQSPNPYLLKPVYARNRLWSWGAAWVELASSSDSPRCQCSQETDDEQDRDRFFRLACARLSYLHVFPVNSPTLPWWRSETKI
ncbi:hypothetical protein B0H66DRAFT_588279 [Apodospora peruviana]|uniref:Uncharacterized protein n=1 Tax=Apodospora peruviana TaxID=516989 RepID=A0AAE0IJH6_9PEZI|nr:hypothetical protein B0H66DRAFT_588279 [Apodospora peruviana]